MAFWKIASFREVIKIRFSWHTRKLNRKLQMRRLAAFKCIEMLHILVGLLFFF